MRRSGITSRSKCAIFSMSQMSCSSAGPRGPAVMMLVLSATGAPVALVKTFDEDMVNSYVLCLRLRKFARARRNRGSRGRSSRPEAGSLSASTSAFTLPKVVAGLCRMPS